MEPGREHTTEAFIEREYRYERFDGAELSGTEMAGCVFARCSFRGAVLGAATTRGCSFEDCDSTDARLNGSEHRESAFRAATLFSAEFFECKLVVPVRKGQPTRLSLTPVT